MFGKLNLVIIMICIIIFILCTPTVFANDITVILEQPKLTTQEMNGVAIIEIEISGRISSGAGNQVTIIIKNSHLVKVYQDQSTSGENGDFKFKHYFDNNVSEGVYSVKVGGYDVATAASTTFNYQKPSNDANLEEFCLEGKTATIQGENISLTLPTNTIVSRAIAIFKASKNAMVYVNNVPQYSGTTSNDFSLPIKYTVVSENRKTQNEYMVTITVQKSNQNSSSGGSGRITSTVTVDKTTVNHPISTPEVNNPNKTPIFNDISDVQWAKEHIENLANKGIITGVGEGRFEPNRTVLREEFIKLLVAAFYLDLSTEPAYFDDVDNTKWYSNYIAVAIQKKMANGVANHLFGIGQSITRQDMATMVFRSSNALGLNLKIKTPYVEFSDDEKIADYAKEAVKSLRESGIIAGDENNAFNPQNNLTRAEAAIIIDILTKEVK